MKSNVLAALVVVISMAGTVFAVVQGKPISVDGGDNATFTRSVVPAPGASAGVVISTYSYTRLNLQCKNIGTTQIFIGDYAGIGNASTGTYQVDPATAGATSFYTTNTKEQLWAISNPGGSTITCEEDR